MRTIKLLPLLFFIVISCNTTNAQTIERVKLLFYSFSLAEFPNVNYDSVVITKKSNDTTWFSTSFFKKRNYYRAGAKVYSIDDSSNATLYYDYNLKKDDLFVRDNSVGGADTYRVDSVYDKKMNHRTFKAWHLTHILPSNSGHPHWEWIEGIGELSVGWDTKRYYFTDGGWILKGICLNDSVIHWYTDYKYFREREPLPTCDFDSVAKRLSIDKQLTADVFTFYPNPASDVVNIISKANGSMSIMDLTGKICLKDIPLIIGSNRMSLSGLNSGVYLMSVQLGNDRLYKKISIVNCH